MASSMPVRTSYERPVTFSYRRITNDHPAFGLSFVLSFNTSVAAAVARTDWSRLSAGAHNRHCCRYNSNPQDLANGEFENARERHSGYKFARAGYQSDGLVRA